jgi:hypothetical protein
MRHARVAFIALLTLATAGCVPQTTSVAGPGAQRPAPVLGVPAGLGQRQARLLPPGMASRPLFSPAPAAAALGTAVDAAGAQAMLAGNTVGLIELSGRQPAQRVTWHIGARDVTTTGDLEGQPATRSRLPLERRAATWQGAHLCRMTDFHGLQCMEVRRLPNGAHLLNPLTAALPQFAIEWVQTGDALMVAAEYDRLLRNEASLSPQDRARLDPRAQFGRALGEAFSRGAEERIRRDGWIGAFDGETPYTRCLKQYGEAMRARCEGLDNF